MVSALRMLQILTLTALLLTFLYGGRFLATNQPLAGASAFSAWWKQQQRAEQLQHVQVVMAHREETKEAILSDLIDGHLSLPSAARDLYAALERGIDNGPDFRLAFPGQSLEESILRWTICCAKTHLEDDSRAAKVLHRLHAELQDYLQDQHNQLSPPYSTMATSSANAQ